MYELYIEKYDFLNMKLIHTLLQKKKLVYTENEKKAKYLIQNLG